MSGDRGIDGSPEAESHLRELDGILPESVDRREFLTGAIVTTTAALTGCLSEDDSTSDGSGDDGGGNDNGGSSDNDTIERDVIWRTAWKDTPNYATSHVAQLEEFWSDQDITSPTVETGNGSGDTAKRVGTGEEAFGLGSITPVISGLAEGYELSIFGVAKARSQIALIYRSDRIDGPSDIVDKRIVSASALNTQAWPMYAAAVGEPNVEIESADESAAAAMLASGDADATFDTFNDLGPIREQVEEQSDATVEAAPLYNQVPAYGYPLYVNNEWLNQEGNQEYVIRALSGYSHAMKWVLLHPEEAVDIMRTDVNQALQTSSQEALLDEIKAGVATTNLTQGARENGLCYLDETVLENSLTEIADAIGVEKTTIENAADLSIQEDAELAQLSSDEFDQITEFAKPYIDLFE